VRAVLDTSVLIGSGRQKTSRARSAPLRLPSCISACSWQGTTANVHAVPLATRNARELAVIDDLVEVLAV
jgi:hypothetical protein